MIKLKNIINYSFLIFLGLVLLLNFLFKDNGSYSTQMTFSPLWVVFLILMVGGIIYLSILSSGLISRLLIRYHKLIIISLFIFYVVAQIIFLKKFIVTPSWDFGNIIDGSVELLKNHQLTPYLLLFQNNIPVALLLSFFNLIGFKSLFSLGLLNIIFIDLALIYLLLVVKKIFKNKLPRGQAVEVFLRKSLYSNGLSSPRPSRRGFQPLDYNIYSIFIATIFFISFLPFLFYVPIVYTDTLSLPFVTMGIYYFISKEGKITDNIYELILALLSISIGALIKPSLIIILIATIIVLFIYHKKKYYCLLPLIIFLAINFTYTSAIWNGKVINNMQKSVNMPQTHYLMMGQNTQSLGIYYGPDVALDQDKIKQGVPIKQIESENVHLAIGRISERGFKGNLSFVILKISKTWNEPDFYSLNKLNRQPVNPQFIAFLQQNKVLAFILDSFYLTILCLSFYAGWRSVAKRKKEPEIFMLLKLSLLGIFIFLIFWETRSRYLLNFIPLLLLYATYGLHLLVEKKVDIKQSEMKILLITQWYKPIRSAASNRTARIAEHLVKSGHKVTVLTGLPSYPTGILPQKYHRKLWFKEKIDKISVIRTYEYPAPNKGIFKRLFNNISFMISASVAVIFLPTYDLVIVSSPAFLAGIPGLLATKKRFIFDVRDLWPDSAIDMGLIRQPLLVKLAENLEKKYYNAAESIFVATPAIKRHLESEGIDPEKIKLVLNSADSALFQPKKLDRSKFGFNKDDFIITYVGNHSRVYDLETVLKAAKILQNYPKIKFIFIGDGETKEDMVLESQKMALSNVDFLPSQDLDEIAHYLNLSDITLIPLVSIKVTQESMPSKTAEYLCAGKPILASIGGDLKDILIRHQVGLVYPPRNPQKLVEVILKIYKNPNLKQKMGQNARKLGIKQFSNRIFIKAINHIID